MDIHGHPGSASGEAHSGCTMGRTDVVSHAYADHYFNTEWNAMLCIDAVEVMAQRCADEGDTCYGVGVLNEYQRSGNDPNWHEFIKKYYRDAAVAARAVLPMDKPIVLFAWEFFYWSWTPDDFDEKIVGKLVWDTHMYGQFRGSMEEVVYDIADMLEGLGHFRNKMNTSTLMGEFAPGHLNPTYEDQRDSTPIYFPYARHEQASINSYLYQEMRAA